MLLTADHHRLKQYMLDHKLATAEDIAAIEKRIAEEVSNNWPGRSDHVLLRVHY